MWYSSKMKILSLKYYFKRCCTLLKLTENYTVSGAVRVYFRRKLPLSFQEKQKNKKISHQSHIFLVCRFEGRHNNLKVPCVQDSKIDLRFQILTKDSVTVYVNAIMYYKVKDATSAVANVDDYSGSARLLAATTLRNVLGTKNLGDILSERESIAQEMKVLMCIVQYVHVHTCT